MRYSAGEKVNKRLNASKKNANAFTNRQQKICSSCNETLVRNLQRMLTIERAKYRKTIEKLRQTLQTERKNCNKFLKEMQIIIDGINLKIDLTNQQLRVCRNFNWFFLYCSRFSFFFFSFFQANRRNTEELIDLNGNEQTERIGDENRLRRQLQNIRNNFNRRFIQWILCSIRWLVNATIAL